MIRSDPHHILDRSVEMSDELAFTLASIQEMMIGMTRRLDQLESSRHELPTVAAGMDETVRPAPQTVQVPSSGVSFGVPFQLSSQFETAPPPAATVPVAPSPIVPIIEDTRLIEHEARMERLESRMRQIGLHEKGLTWDDSDGIPVGSLPPNFSMPDIERYSGLGCPKSHLRLYSSVMRAHRLDDSQLVALFPMSLSGVAQRWYASVEPSRVRTWEDVTHEFLIQFASSVDIDVSRRELEATRQRPDETVSSFVSRWRTQVANMIDRPKEHEQIDMVLRNLQPRFARRLVGIPFHDLRSLFQAAFSVEDAIARGLWSDDISSHDVKGKKPMGSFSGRSGEVSAISHHQRPFYQPPYRPFTFRARTPTPQYQLQPSYDQQSYVAHASVHPRPQYQRAFAPQQPRPPVQRPMRQFTPLGMTSVQAFEKLKVAGLITPLSPRPLPHPVPPHYRLHEFCSYHQGHGHDTEHCTSLRHAIQDLIDSGAVSLSSPSVTTNPLPTFSTHAVPPPPSLQ